MALINCPECGVQFSEFASACPQCGYPIKKDSSPSYTIPPKEPVSAIPKKGNTKKYFRVSGFGMLIVIVIVATMPFHYIPSRSLVFPKDHLTFTNTFITESDIEDIINRFNRASFFEKLSMMNDPFMKNLKEHDIIVNISDKNPESTENPSETASATENEEPMIKIDTPKVKSFIKRYYELSLSKDFNGLLNYYANPTEQFFGKSNVSPEEIIRGASAYYKKFTFLSCQVDYENMKITKNMSQVYFVEYKVDLTIKKESTGKLLKINDLINLKIDENFQISSITEKILSKSSLN
jgi:hypothetical protein